MQIYIIIAILQEKEQQGGYSLCTLAEGDTIEVNAIA